MNVVTRHHADNLSTYYFQFKKLSNHRGLIGRLSEAEILNLLGSRVIGIATPELYPPGCLVWHDGDLTPEELEICRWLAFVSEIYQLVGTETVEEIDKLRSDYDAFEAFLEAAEHRLVLTVDGSWVEQVVPQAFDYQSPARQSPYLIRAMFNLSYGGKPIRQVLDPMGGYGQTLFECVLRGIDGASLEISPTASGRSAENLRKLFNRLQIPFEESREDNRYLFGAQRSYQIINGDTRQADRYFRGQQFDSLITDFPYGVQAGARTEKMQPANFAQLLDAALPSWKRLLSPEGVIVIAYNLYSLPRETVLGLIRKHGFRQRFPDADLSEQISDKIFRDIVVIRNA